MFISMNKYFLFFSFILLIFFFYNVIFPFFLKISKSQVTPYYPREIKKERKDTLEKKKKVFDYRFYIKIFGGGVLIIILFGLLLIFISYLLIKNNPYRHRGSDFLFLFGYFLSYPCYYLSSFCHFQPFEKYSRFIASRYCYLMSI